MVFIYNLDTTDTSNSMLACDTGMSTIIVDDSTSQVYVRTVSATTPQSNASSAVSSKVGIIDCKYQSIDM